MAESTPATGTAPISDRRTEPRGVLPGGYLTWRSLTTGEPDRVEYEHVALERAQRDAGLRHRVDEILVGDGLEQRKLADHAVVRIQPGW